jgi:Ca2+-binding RTX toxin-like protein
MKRLVVVLLLVLFPVAALAAGQPVIKGTANNDTLIGTKKSEIFYGYKGADKIFSGSGFDTIYDGPGNDHVVSKGSALFYNGPGDDYFRTEGKDMTIIKDGLGNDRYHGFYLSINASKGGGRDRAVFEIGDIYDGPGADYYKVGSIMTGSLNGGGNTIDSRQSNGLVKVGASGDNNTYQGGPGEERIIDAGVGNRFYGRGGNDSFENIGKGDKSAKLTEIYGGQGRDKLVTGINRNVILAGGEGDDRLESFSSSEVVIRGGLGKDVIDFLNSDGKVIPGAGADAVAVFQSRGTLDTRDGEVDDIDCIQSPQLIVYADPEDNVFGCTLAP